MGMLLGLVANRFHGCFLLFKILVRGDLSLASTGAVEGKLSILSLYPAEELTHKSLHLLGSQL
jgi:hypothetical protein